MKPLPLSRPVGIRRMVKVCAWCPEPIVQAQTATLHRMGCVVTHGICADSAAYLRGEIAEKPATVKSAIIAPEASSLGIIPRPSAAVFHGLESAFDEAREQGPRGDREVGR